MLIKISERMQGGRSIVEFSDDGTQILAELEGQLELGKPVHAWIQAACDNNENGYDRLLEALAWLAEETRKRKGSAVSVSE